jgi:hypothetical protein
MFFCTWSDLHFENKNAKKATTVLTYFRFQPFRESANAAYISPGLEIFGSAPHFLAANFSHVFKHGSKYEIPAAMLNIQELSGNLLFFFYLFTRR